MTLRCAQFASLLHHPVDLHGQSKKVARAGLVLQKFIPGLRPNLKAAQRDEELEVVLVLTWLGRRLHASDRLR